MPALAANDVPLTNVQASGPSTKGFSGSVLIVSGSNRETVQLAVNSDNSLKGEAKNPVPVGAVVTLVLKNAAGKSGQVKF